MSTSDVMNDGQQRHTDGKTSLVDGDIITVKVDRRSFLAKAAGAGSLAFGAVLAASCGSDQCDNDIGVTHADDKRADDAGADDAIADDAGADSCDAD